MVLVNGLTIDDINAALIALQRSRTEVVGGEKGTTVQNISVSNSSSGGGKNYDLQILQLQNDVKAVDEKIGQVQSETTGRINELSVRLADLQVEQLAWNESNRILTLITAGGDYDVQIPSETVTLSLNSSNELTFTMGVNENNDPQIVKVTLPYIRTSEKGVAGGVASLDSSGRVPYSQLPESAMEFKGEWDASINYPHLEDGTGTNGDFYICSAGGTVNFGTQASPRNITFYPNDRVIYEGSNAQWFRLPAGEVRTVNGMSGDVVLTANNIMYDSNQTIKQKIDSASQANWTQTDSTQPDFIKNKIPIWITSGSADDNMSPIDSVTDGSMRPITSNAVYDKIASLDVASVGGSGKYIEAISETDGKISATVQNISDTVAANNMQSVTSNAVYNAINCKVLPNYLQSIKIDYKTGTMPTAENQEKEINLIARGTNEEYILLGCRVLRPGTDYVYDITTVGDCLFKNNKAILYINASFAPYVGGAPVGVLYAIGTFRPTN